MLRVDFEGDWTEFLGTDMAAYGSAYDPSENLRENTVTYLNAKRRIVPRCKRAVQESKELQIPPQHSTDYGGLKKLISEGGDLTPYLSHDIQKKRADKNDGVLNSWGFHYLHFSPKGDIDVLFVRITETDVFVLKTLPHGRGYPETWVDTELLRIMHENWPDAAVGMVVGIRGESPMPTERTNLRSKNVNFATTMPDGTVYLAPGGGITGSGRCSLDVSASDYLLSQLPHWQRVVEENETDLRSALNVPSPKELCIRMRFDNGEWRLYQADANREIRLIVTPSAA